MNETKGPIGVFDSGYGGLTVLKELVQALPDHDFLYLGDNARSPYGTRSFESVYHYTLECVNHLFDKGCHLVILACNTASAKALRTIQQNDLPKIKKLKRVLGVIRPTTEVIGKYSKSGKVGILGTGGTIASNSYLIEINKFFPNVKVYQQACPMWVPLVENNEFESPGTDYFVKKYVDKLLSYNPAIDTILLACTHYPLLLRKINEQLPPGVGTVMQGKIVAESLKDYLLRHPEIEELCSQNGLHDFYTTDSTELFDQNASIFFGKPIQSKHLKL